MNGHRLKNRTRLAVLAVVGVALLGIGNSAYHASNLCLADARGSHAITTSWPPWNGSPLPIFRALAADSRRLFWI